MHALRPVSSVHSSNPKRIRGTRPGAQESDRASPLTRRSILAATTLLLIQHSAVLKAAVAFDSFGPEKGFEMGGVTINWEQSTSVGKYGEPVLNTRSQAVALPFTVSENYRFDALTLVIGKIDGAANLTVSLVSDFNGKPSPTSMEVLWTDSGIAPGMHVLTFTSLLSPELKAGSSYWVLLEPAHLEVTSPDSSARYFWAENNQSLRGPLASRGYNGGWFNWGVIPLAYLPAAKIEGTIVPEPNSGILCALSTIAIAGATRIRKVVPE